MRSRSRRYRIFAVTAGILVAGGLTVVFALLLLIGFSKASWCLNTRSYLWTTVTGDGAPPPSHFTGTWKQWWINGTLMAEFEVRDGVLEGSYVSWTDYGAKSTEGSYVNGKREGQWVYYHDNGRKWREFSYKEGMEHGYVKEWDERGHLETFIWKHNDMWVISLDTAGIPGDFTGAWKRTGLHGGREEIEVRDGRMDGEFRSWYRNGWPSAHGYLKEGVPDGKLVLWQEDGPKMGEAMYANGVQHGKEMAWDWTGELVECRWWYQGRAVSQEQFEALAESSTQSSTEPRD